MASQTQKLCSLGAAIAVAFGAVAAPLPDRHRVNAQIPDEIPVPPPQGVPAPPQGVPAPQSGAAERLDAILRQEVPGLTRQGNQWQLNFAGRELLVLADPESDRMRVLAPIGDAQSVSPEQILRMMVANFHTALDARYAFISDGTVVAVYLHPLSSLQERDLRSALRQVAELADTFGTTYSSGEMIFGPGTQPGEARPGPGDDVI